MASGFVANRAPTGPSIWDYIPSNARRTTRRQAPAGAPGAAPAAAPITAAAPTGPTQANVNPNAFMQQSGMSGAAASGIPGEVSGIPQNTNQFPKGLVMPIDSTTMNRDPAQKASIQACMQRNPHCAPDIQNWMNVRLGQLGMQPGVLGQLQQMTGMQRRPRGGCF